MTHRPRLWPVFAGTVCDHRKGARAVKRRIARIRTADKKKPPCGGLKSREETPKEGM